MNTIESDNVAHKKSQARVIGHTLTERLLGFISGITVGWGISFILSALILDRRGWEVENWTVYVVACMVGLVLIVSIASIIKWSNHK